jgi:3-phenylpropionate/cinnamic acid dioxygenase small subunit
MVASIEQPVPTAVYAEVQQFYARHIHLLDDGHVTEAVDTFTEDASFLSPPKISEPVRGKEDLLAGFHAAERTLAQSGERYRRCYTMMAVQPQEDGTVHVRSYVQVIVTRHGEVSRLHAMCVCEDVLVRQNGELKIYDRVVTRDDVA